ncbi:MAG: ABC transporter ATP-binding protein, partial [Kiritimatiellae bacterium]|nr:ABC transporter ATP-binding protein [Kiritimatiellia bacterium]
MSASGYRKEFFDREYGAKEAYSRLWVYARRYWPRLALGVICGMLTAGTLLPLYQAIQPTLRQVESMPVAEESQPVAHAGDAAAASEGQSGVPKDFAREEKKLGKELGNARKWAAKLGIELEDEDGAVGLPLLAVIIFVVPLVALARLALVFLNHYCLTWAGMKTVRDIRVDALKHIQRQSMQFHGRIDVGQLMSRATGDPAQVQMIIQSVLQELAQAPFEIIVSVAFIIWTAAVNHMLPTLMIIFVGFPMFMIPVVALSKAIRKWSKRALEQGSVIGGRLHEILTCIRVVKAYNTEELENRKYEEANDMTLKACMRALRWGLAVGPAVETIGILLICAFIVWCFFMKVKLSTIIPMLAPLLMIYKPIKQVSRLQVQVEQGRAALARIWSLLDLDMELPEKAEPVAKKSFDDKIVFDNVSFRYDTAERDAVHGASFEIERGKVVAVVGGTGSGKSTMS